MLTVIIALLAGLLGTVVGALLQGRGERLAQLRDRQLSAADEFVAAATELFVALSAAMERIEAPEAGQEQQWLAKMEEATSESRANAHRVTRSGARLELLFGRASPTASAAMELTRRLLKLTAELKAQPGSVERVTKEYDAAADALGEFSRLAHGAITAPMWKRLPRAT